MRKGVKYFLFFLFIGIWYYLRLKYYQLISINKIDFIFGLLLILYFLSTSFMESLKHKSPQFISFEVHNSIADEPIEILDWVILRLGGIDHELFGRIEGRDQIVVVPKKLLFRLGRNYFVDARLVKIKNYNYLPPEVAQYIKKNQLFSKEYYIGLNPILGFSRTEYKLDNLVLSYIQINDLISLMEDRFNSVDKLINAIERYVKALRKADEDKK